MTSESCVSFVSEGLAGYELRAARESDHAFLRRLHREALKKYIELTWGWDERVQRGMFDESFDPTEQQILMVDGVEAGMLATELRVDSLFLKSIRILPEYQHRGLGSRIIRDLLRQANRESVPVVLQALKVNRDARRLYERLGFKVSGETETLYLMRCELPARHR